MSDVNPYAAPIDLVAQPPIIETNEFVRRDGKFLLVWDGAVLPKRCVRTNQDLESPEGGKMLKRKLTWTPQWVWATMLIMWLIAVILASVLQKRCTVVYGLSNREIAKFRNRKIFGALAFLGGFGGIFYAIGTLTSSEENLLIIAIISSVVVMIAGLIFLTRSVPLRAVGYINGWFRVKGCSKEFLDSIGPA